MDWDELEGMRWRRMAARREKSPMDAGSAVNRVAFENHSALGKGTRSTRAGCSGPSLRLYEKSPLPPGQRRRGLSPAISEERGWSATSVPCIEECDHIHSVHLAITVEVRQ